MRPDPSRFPAARVCSKAVPPCPGKAGHSRSTGFAERPLPPILLPARAGRGSPGACAKPLQRAAIVVVIVGVHAAHAVRTAHVVIVAEAIAEPAVVELAALALTAEPLVPHHHPALAGVRPQQTRPHRQAAGLAPG